MRSEGARTASFSSTPRVSMSSACRSSCATCTQAHVAQATSASASSQPPAATARNGIQKLMRTSDSAASIQESCARVASMICCAVLVSPELSPAEPASWAFGISGRQAADLAK